VDLSTDNIAVIVLVAVVVLDKIISTLKSRGIDLQLVSKQINDLYEWHNVNDTEGVKIWYVRRSLEDAINKLADNIDIQTKLWDRIDRRLEAIEKSVPS